MSKIQDRLMTEIEANGFLVLRGAAEHSAALALERKGLVVIDNRAAGGIYGADSRDTPFTAYSLSDEWK